MKGRVAILSRAVRVGPVQGVDLERRPRGHLEGAFQAENSTPGISEERQGVGRGSSGVSKRSVRRASCPGGPPEGVLPVPPRRPEYSPLSVRAALRMSRCAAFGPGSGRSLQASRTCVRPRGGRVAQSPGPRSRDTRAPVSPSPQAPALRCACALALVCLALLLLLRPRGALGEALQPQQPPGPRAADWLSNFAHFNKYLEKLFNSRWAGGEREGGRTGRGWGRKWASPGTPPTALATPRSVQRRVPQL